MLLYDWHVVLFTPAENIPSITLSKLEQNGLFNFKLKSLITEPLITLKDCTLFFSFLFLHVPLKRSTQPNTYFPWGVSGYEVPWIVSTICVQLSLLSSKIHNVSLWQPFLPVQMVWEMASPTLGNGMLKTRTGASSYTLGRNCFLANLSKCMF